MAAYCRSHDAYLAPHGKTTMAPELWRRQFEHGAWALTVAVPHQVQAAREFGVNRILLANELVDGPAIAWVAQESEADSGFEFYCYVDSPEACRLMEKVVSEVAPSVVLNVVIEVGWSGGRTGCRTFEDVMELAEAISQCSHLTLVGLAGFEGAVGDNRSSATLKEVRSFLEFVARCYASLTDGHRFGETPPPYPHAWWQRALRCRPRRSRAVTHPIPGDQSRSPIRVLCCPRLGSLCGGDSIRTTAMDRPSV